MPTDPRPIREVFVGSTIQDLRTYREQVRKSLARIRVGAYLSEHWVGGHDETLRLCRERLDGADAYFGIFAYWYGSVPPQGTRSITHEEFLWAADRWDGRAPPLYAVFMPKGKAARALRARADALFLEAHAHCSAQEREAARAVYANRVSAFHRAVRQRADVLRIVNEFDSSSTLGELAVVTIHQWAEDLFRTAGAPLVDAPREVAPEELGMLGRRVHARAAQQAVAALAAAPDAPGVCLLVAGREDAGQGELCSHLITLRSFRDGRPVRGRPHQEHYSLETFIAWCGKALGVASADAPVGTIAVLAERIHQVLRDRPLTLVVNQVELFPGGTAGFHEHFWRPLFTALRDRRAAAPSARRLIVVAADYRGRAADWEGVSREAGEGGDPAHLVRLPPLRDITRGDVLEWMEDLDVPDDPPGRRMEILERVLPNTGADEDGTPWRVYGRIRNETLWPDSE